MLCQLLQNMLALLPCDRRINYFYLANVVGVIAPPFYRAQIGFLMAASPNWGAAGVFYLLFVAGLVVFVISPGIEAGAPSRAVWRGAFFGLIAYATYDLTNLATLDRWPLLLTVVDMAWGASLSAATAWLGVWAGRKLETGGRSVLRG